MLQYCIGLPLTYDQSAGGLSEVSLQQKMMVNMTAVTQITAKA